MAKTKIDDLAIVLSASSEQLAGDLRAAAKLLDNFRDKVDKSAGVTDNARAAAKEVAAQKKAAKESAEAWKEMKSTMRGVAASAAAIPVAGLLIGTGGVVAVHSLAAAYQEFKESIDLAADLEQTTLAFEVMLKSQEKATALLGEVRQFAATTPFNNTELVNASRQLIAYGIAAQQTVPTLRMLGDVSAATQTPIGELTYLYGTLAAQGRAYTKDIQQFAGRGIPIYDELAKVLGKARHEVQSLVEEGRVGFPEVVRAFKAMTSGAGLYAGLTSRQADTFAGVREQFFDAIQMGKTKFGKVLIDELGLKDAAKNVAKFIENVDIDRIRPVVRFFGDFAHSVVQVGYELGKAAAQGISFFRAISKESFPGVHRFIDDALDFINGMKDFGKDFRIDPMVINDTIFGVHDALLGIFIDVLRGIRDIGGALQNNIVDPLGKIFEGLNRNIVGAKEYVGTATREDRFRVPSPYEPDESIIKRWKALSGEIWQTQMRYGLDEHFNKLPSMHPAQAEELARNSELRKAYEKRFAAELDPLLDMRDAFAKPFLGSGTDAKGRDWRYPNHFFMAENKVPSMAGRQPIVLGDDGLLSNYIRRLEESRKSSRGLARDIHGRLAEEQAAKAARDAEKAMVAFAGMTMSVARDSVVEKPMAAFAGAAMSAARELGNFKQAMEEVLVPLQLPPDTLDTIRNAKQQFPDPLKVFREQYENLNTGLFLSEFDPSAGLDVKTYTKARDALVMRTAEMLGIGGPVQLPSSGAQRGSAESVRILNQAGMGTQNVEQLLQQILDLIRAETGGGGGFFGRMANMVATPAVIPR